MPEQCSIENIFYCLQQPITYNCDSRRAVMNETRTLDSLLCATRNVLACTYCIQKSMRRAMNNMMKEDKVLRREPKSCPCL